MIDAAFLGGFGTLEVSPALWQALRRFAAWVEPALIAEWTRLMRGHRPPQASETEPVLTSLVNFHFDFGNFEPVNSKNGRWAPEIVLWGNGTLRSGS